MKRKKFPADYFEKGFTVIEIIIVIFIAGIIALLSLPAYRTYQPSAELSGTAQELIIDLRYAQQLAITEQINHGVRFNSSTEAYQIIKYGASEEVLKEKELPPRVMIEKVSNLNNDEAVFNPYGAAAEAGTITLINTNNATRTISVKASGFVKIID